MKQIRLLLVDDHPAFRRGVSSALEDEADLRVVGEAGTGAEALLLFAKLKPDVVLLDLRLPDIGGVECAVQMVREQPRAKLVILTTYENDHDLARAIAAGVAGYLLKDCALPELCHAIRTVASGGSHIPAHLATRARLQLSKPELTPRELDLLHSLVAGCSNKEAATELSVSEETIKTHLKAILRKLGVQDRTQAAIAALKRGLVRE